MSIHHARPSLLQTRESLLSRLRHWSDHESWHRFFDTYWRLIYDVAVKSGLTQTEAQETVQETVISVAKGLPGFQYDPKKCAFKTWLMLITRRRIADQFRKRQSHEKHLQTEPDAPCLHPTQTEVEEVADPAGFALEKIWDEEWQSNLAEAALHNVKLKVPPKQFQIFELYVLREWPVAQVARTLGVNPARVYLAKHRVSLLIKEEIKALEKRHW